MFDCETNKSHPSLSGGGIHLTAQFTFRILKRINNLKWYPLIVYIYS